MILKPRVMENHSIQKKKINDACKRILKRNKPKTIDTLEDIRKEIIASFNTYSTFIRSQYTPENKQESYAYFDSARDRTHSALTTLQTWAKTLTPSSTHADFARFTELGKHLKVPSVIGNLITNTTVDQNLDWSDPEDTDGDESSIADAEQQVDWEDMAFDIKTAVALVEPFDGSPSKLSLFEDSVNLLQQLSPAGTEATLLTFVKTRLRAKARDIAHSKASIDEIMATLKQHCSDSVTSETIRARLQNCRQRTNAAGFADEVARLTEQLTNLYIKEGVAPDAAHSLSNQFGVDALTSGAKNAQTRLLLKAGMYKTVTEATTKMLKEDSNTTEVSQILRIAHNSNSRGRSRGDSRGTGRGQHSGRGSEQHGGGRGGHRGRRRDRGRGRQDYYQNDNPDRTRSVRQLQAENRSGPQEQQGGTQQGDYEETY